MSVAESKLVTIEQYAQRPADGPPTELVQGKVVEMNLPTPRHGQVCFNASHIIGVFVKEMDLGHLTINDSAIITTRDPDSVRGADVAYYSYSRLPKGPIPAGYLDPVPELVFEVLSDDDRWPRVLAKVAEYLNAEVIVVCVLNPRQQTARLFDANGRDEILNADQDLAFPEILPGFQAPVARFFE